MSDEIQRVHDELKRKGDAALADARNLKASAALKEAEGFALLDSAQAIRNALREQEKTEGGEDE